MNRAPIHRPFSGLITALASMLCIFALGCVATPPGEQAVDPWGPPAADCPDGICPVPGGGGTGSEAGQSGGGIQVSSTGRHQTYQANELALRETKGDDATLCGADCQCGPDCQCSEPGECNDREEVKGNPLCLPCQPFQPTQVQPSAIPKDSPVSVRAQERKTGAFACERCKKPTVGREWKEIWAEDGTSLMCLCQRCFNAMSTTERERTLKAFAVRSSIDLASNPAVAEAILEASRGY